MNRLKVLSRWTLLMVGLALGLVACPAKQPPDREREEDSPATQFIIPEVERHALAGQYTLLGEDVQASKPKAPLDPREKLIQVLNTNLDLDTTGEQILLLKESPEAEAPIKIAVVDYDSVRSSYSRTWEGLTSATNIRTFDIALQDLVGDHNLEILCRGINIQGQLTLDVFRKTPSPTGLGLYFNPIAQIVSDGSIEIEEVERSESYRLGQKNGPSFPIYSYSQDRESENLLDRVKHAYYWQYQQNRYVLASVEKLAGAAVEEKQLAELFASNSIQDLERYLNGPWYLAEAEARAEVILFLPEQEQISIYSGDLQETYIWKRTRHPISNWLYIFAENETIPSIKKWIDIEIISLNSIRVIIRGSERWDRFQGRYVKLTEELQEDLIGPSKGGVALLDIPLAGVYRSQEGVELIFEPPYFTWIEEKRQFSGGFALFQLNRGVLHLKGLDEKGLYLEDKIYIVEFSEKREGQYLYRILELLPGRIGVHGIEPISDVKRIFEQSEFLEEG